MPYKRYFAFLIFTPVFFVKAFTWVKIWYDYLDLCGYASQAQDKNESDCSRARSDVERGIWSESPLITLCTGSFNNLQKSLTPFKFKMDLSKGTDQGLFCSLLECTNSCSLIRARTWCSLLEYAHRRLNKTCAVRCLYVLVRSLCRTSGVCWHVLYVAPNVNSDQTLWRCRLM